MAIRLIEILAPTNCEQHLISLAKKSEPLAVWSQSSEESTQLKVVMRKERVEALLDQLESYMTMHSDVRVAVVALQAFLPRESEEPSPAPIGHTRISREELLSEVRKGAQVTPIYIVTVVLSTLVATIGLEQNSAAVVIGAMVIAPLMGPNIALALGTTLGDNKLLAVAFRANLIGIGIAFSLAFVLGLFFHIPAEWKTLAEFSELAARTKVSPADIILALASGTAGALAYTTGVSSSLVGVMVAVALLPPLVTFSMLLVGHPADAMQAALLLAANVICVNLAGVATFAIQGIRPRTWWDTQRSKRGTRIAITIWLSLLAAVTVILLTR